MVRLDLKVWKLRILCYTLVLGTALFSAQASLFAQTQPAPESSLSAPIVPAVDALQAPLSAPASALAAAPATTASSAKNFFHVKYISEGAIYLDAGHNEGLKEGMLLHICRPDLKGGTTDAVRFQGQEPIANVRIFSVADTSAAAEIIKTHEDLVVGDIAYLDIESAHLRQKEADALESENYPAVVSFSYGDPLDEEIRESATEKMRTLAMGSCP